ncbi:hypothetical protein [Streptomyces sp. XY533]|uniref:hypothetical protein n=1 Tax=Streptomyces sp. XY533 TaxID=1519481 RepID=UPI0006AE2BC5|nr:hypothetical protein [Streptomyces sp. XY533]KOV07495.1 hypothetical protein ADK92_05620 [Streptomyces sp. XY533]
MAALTPGQQATVRRAAESLTASHQLPLGQASHNSLCHNIGRLEIALEQMLRLVNEREGEPS